jgi:hypothetical protein
MRIDGHRENDTDRGTPVSVSVPMTGVAQNGK